MGCMGGLSGALWIHINIAMTRLRGQYIPAHAVRRRLAEVDAAMLQLSRPTSAGHTLLRTYVPQLLRHEPSDPLHMHRGPHILLRH